MALNSMLTPIDWIRTVNKNANLAIKHNWSRYSLDWGEWSATMNRHIRARLSEKSPIDPDSEKLKVVFVYWVLMSQAIEVLHKKRQGFKIDDSRFSLLVSEIEAIKIGVDTNTWPNHTDRFADLIVGFE